MNSILWLPTPPSFGSVSMQRYFGALSEEVERKKANGQDEYHIRPVVPYTGLMVGSKSRIYRAFDKWYYFKWRVARAGEHDLVHALAHGSGHLLPYLKGKPKTIATIHDLIPLRFAGGLTPAQLERFKKQTERLIQFDLLTTVSEFTANEVVELTSIPRSQIRVVQNGIDRELFRQVVPLPAEISHLAGKPYVLSVSSAIERKNLKIFPEVFAEVFSKEPELKLVRVGSLFPVELKERFEKLCGKDKLIELGRVDDEALVPLFQQAKVFFFPSLYEGFGLPVIESMASGCPVVCSNTTSIPEVGGDAALYFDPTDAEAGAAGILEALSDSDRMVANGIEHSRAYSWKNTLEGHLSCYKELLE